MTDEPRPRLAKLRPDDLSVAQRALRATIAGGPRSAVPQLFRLVDDDGALEGPFNAFLLQPAIGEAVQSLGAAVRFHGTLTDRAREIAILLVAAHWGSAFERYAHEAVGAAVGLGAEVLAALREGRTDLLDDDERLLAGTTLRLLESGDLDDASYEAFTARFGTAALFELLTLVGYYAMLALQLRVFRVPVPDEEGR